MKSLRPENSPEMDAAVVGVAGDEVPVWWLAGLKNTMNTVRWCELRRSFGRLRRGGSEELVGGA
jgi:hypothetical protein